MSQADLLRHVAAFLEAAGIEYMITGSIASSLQGEPRAPHDLDVIVAIRGPDVAAVLAAFPQGVVDHSYVTDWAERLGVADLWDRLRGEAEPI